MIEKEIRYKCPKCGEEFVFSIQTDAILKNISTTLICPKCGNQSTIQIVFVREETKPIIEGTQPAIDEVFRNPAPDLPVDLPSTDIKEIIDEE